MPEVNETSLQRYEELFMYFASKMERVAGISLEITDIRSRLDAHGLSELAKFHVGKNIEDQEVQEIFLKVFRGAYHELIQPAFGKFKRK